MPAEDPATPRWHLPDGARAGISRLPLHAQRSLRQRIVTTMLDKVLVSTGVDNESLFRVESSIDLDELAARVPLELLPSPDQGTATSVSPMPLFLGAFLGPLLTSQRRYRFVLLNHPYTCRFLVALRRGGLDGLFQLSQQCPDQRPALDFSRQ